jgi:hypothetical protein
VPRIAIDAAKKNPNGLDNDIPVFLSKTASATQGSPHTALTAIFAISDQDIFPAAKIAE